MESRKAAWAGPGGKTGLSRGSGETQGPGRTRGLRQPSKARRTFSPPLARSDLDRDCGPSAIVRLHRGKERLMGECGGWAHREESPGASGLWHFLRASSGYVGLHLAPFLPFLAVPSRQA